MALLSSSFMEILVYDEIKVMHQHLSKLAWSCNSCQEYSDHQAGSNQIILKGLLLTLPWSARENVYVSYET